MKHLGFLMEPLPLNRKFIELLCLSHFQSPILNPILGVTFAGHIIDAAGRKSVATLAAKRRGAASIEEDELLFVLRLFFDDV